MRVVEYVVLLGNDGRRRVRHTRVGGNVTEFMVQYEVFVEGKWHEVVRYDTSHGYAHKDLIHADGRKEKVTLFFKDLKTTGSGLHISQNGAKSKTLVKADMEWDGTMA